MLGLLSCKRLKVITLNFAVRITHVTLVTLVKKDHANNGIDWHVGTIPWPKALDHKLETSTTSDKDVDWHAGTIPQISGRIISRQQLIQKYPDHFKGVCRFTGTYKIHLKKGAKPVIHPQWEWPIEMHDILKKKLHWMEEEQFITKVTKPTDWVNSLAYSWKLNRGWRVCLDPKDLNKAIKHTYHKIPTVEEVTCAFAGSKFFSKLDAKSAFWCKTG